MATDPNSRFVVDGADLRKVKTPPPVGKLPWEKKPPRKLRGT